MLVPWALHYTRVLTGTPSCMYLGNSITHMFSQGLVFSDSVIKYPDINNLKEKGFVLAHCPRGVESFTAGRTWQQAGTWGQAVTLKAHSGDAHLC